MPIVRPSCPHCSRPMSLGAEAGEFACQCGATMGEGVLTLRWTVGKKHLASKKTRLILKTRQPDLLFTLAPDVAASNLEGRCAALLGSNPKALASVRCISMAHGGLHLASASLGDGESEEIHHSFDSNPHCVVPLSVDLRAARERDADELQLTFVICWALCL